MPYLSIIASNVLILHSVKTTISLDFFSNLSSPLIFLTISGIISRLDHLEYIGVEIIWLSPIYPSPMVDFGYDISDFINVDPIFGTLENLDDLVRAVHSKGMKLLMDYIPNHSSDKHKWFESSRRREEPFSDYYIWHDGKTLEDGTRAPPNNWVS